MARIQELQRALLLVALVAAVVHGAGVQLEAGREAFALAGGVFLLALWAAAASVVLRAIGDRLHRPAWVLFAAGVTAEAAGWTVHVMTVGRGAALELPGPADPLWISGAVFAGLGLVVLLRAEIRRARVTLVIDSVMAALVVLSTVVAFLMPELVQAGMPDGIDGVLLLLYPIGPVLFLALCFAAAAVAGWRPARHWIVLGVGATLPILANAMWSQRVAVGTWEPVMGISAWFPLWFVAVGWAALVERSTGTRRAAEEDWRVVAGSLVGAAIAVGVLIAGAVAPALPLVAVGLAVAGLVAALGRTGLSLFDDVLGSLQNRRDRATVRRLREALAADELCLHYHPLVDVPSGRVVGVEALLRWECDGALLQPCTFLPAAERNAIVDPLTDWVLDRALADLAGWRREGRDLAVSVNLAPANLGDLDLPRRVEDLLERHDVPAARLTLEVTETAVFGDDDRAACVLDGLSALGVTLSLDDFGTGYSSLSRLTRFPFGELKVDRTFVGDLAADHRAVLPTVIELARTLDLRVVAEGVEDPSTLDALVGLRCDTAQGFLFTRPLPASELPAWLARHDAGYARDDAPVIPVIARAATPADAARATVEHLLSGGLSLISVYVERSGRMRCLASDGYAHVLDGIPVTSGILGHTVSTGIPSVLSDTHGDPRFLAATDGVLAEICWPMWVEGRVIGAINVESHEALPPGAEDDVAAAAAALARRMGELARDLESEPERLARLVGALRATGTRSELAERAIAGALELAGMDSALLALRSSDGTWSNEVHGPYAPVVRGVADDRLDALMEYLSCGATCISAHAADGVGPAALEHLGRRGVGQSIALALGRDAEHGLDGVLLLMDARPGACPPRRIELLELFVAQVAASLQASTALERLRVQAAEDPLTGLGHRGAFNEALAAIRESGRPTALVMLDVDGFKAVNDGQGHLAGDRVLITLAARMTDAVRRDDAVFRLGGDEFAALVHAPTMQDAWTAAERLVATATGLEIGLSAGIALIDGSTIDEDVVRRADAAMYEAKRAGGARVAT